jgi:hypothetical protein
LVQDTLYQFVEFFSFGVTLVLLLLWVRFKEGRLFSSIGFRGRNPIGKLFLGFVIGAVMMTGGVLVPWGLGHYVTGGSVHTNLGSAALTAVIPLVIVFVLQASTEEAVFRGYLLQVTGSPDQRRHCRARDNGLLCCDPHRLPAHRDHQHHALRGLRLLRRPRPGQPLAHCRTACGTAILVVAVVVSFVYYRRKEAQRRAAGEHVAVPA